MSLGAIGEFLAAEKFWILDPLYNALGNLLAWFYAVIPSFGVAIVLLTVAVSILRMPLVAKQVKSQQEMQRIQPELKRIQTKYKSEPQKRNEELMKLYKEHNVNPFAGCLPILLQMPLFIVLYRLIMDLGRPEPKHVPTTSALFRELSESGGRMKSFGMDLAEKASDVQGFGKLLPYALLIAAVVGTGLFQQRQMTSRLPKEAQNSQLAIMGKIFPAFLGFISFSIPAGVVVYFLVSNVWQIGQQAFLFRRKQAREAVGSGDKAGGSGMGGKTTDAAAKPAASGGLFARLAKATSAAASGGAPPPEAKPGSAKGASRDGKAAGSGGGSGGGGAAARAGGGGGGGGAAARAGGGRNAKNGKAGGAKSAAKGSSGGRGGRGGGDGAGGAKGGGGGRASGNGRVTPRGGGRPQGKGQAGRSKSRNSRRGK
jgi:YidC/Oxa1 family membrane protein insertase